MEEKALYRPILKKAWSVTKKFRNLWFFGLFVALLGVSGEYEILSRAFFNPLSGKNGILVSTMDSFKDGWILGTTLNGLSWTNIWSAVSGSPQTFIFVILILILGLAITLFLIWLGIISQIGIIRNSDLNSKNKPTTINDGIDFAVKNFWSVLASNIILKIILFAIFMILGVELTALIGQGIFGVIIYYLSFIILVMVIFTVSFLIRYQIFYLTLKKEKYIKSFSSAWKLLQNNWLISLEMAFILFLFYLAAATITTIITILFIASIWALFIYFSVPLWTTAIMSLLLLIIAIIVIFIITAMLNTFQWTSWVLLFNRLTKSESISKIIRFANFPKN